ncbi:hypothetical protein [Nocardia terpenica]|uniref:Uncharacterized protein n=1 Tax=Nocardia terpenica TaxID=455432 RepID=A0A6G9ZDM0_9NOCA|nr:hypothetical protein [Nocardia terpenica]QIS23638.1 hypothetical protein F6W96_40595 [Nocardia terpenica]
MSLTLAVFDAIVTTPSPGPVPGQSGNIIDPVLTTPPGYDKIRILLGVFLSLVAAFLVGLFIYSGGKFASAYLEGHTSTRGMLAPLFCAGGAIITGTAATWVTMFMGGS